MAASRHLGDLEVRGGPSEPSRGASRRKELATKRFVVITRFLPVESIRHTYHPDGRDAAA